MTLSLAQDADADAMLARDPLALLLGMLLDQQIPLERAFGAPYRLAQRIGVADLDAAALAAHDPATLVEVFAMTPALHRYPKAMAQRTQNLAQAIVDGYAGDTGSLWREATSGADLLTRLERLPGFGRQKAQIFVALLGKRLGVRPEGWREAAGQYGVDGSYMSVADITDQASLDKVREYKQRMKAVAGARPGPPDQLTA